MGYVSRRAALSVCATLLLATAGCGRSKGTSNGGTPASNEVSVPSIPNGVALSIEGQSQVKKITRGSFDESNHDKQRSEARWRTTSHTEYTAEVTADGLGAYQVTARFEYAYEDDGRMVADTYSDGNAIFSRYDYEWNTNQSTRALTLYSEGEAYLHRITTTTEQDNGSSLLEQCDETGTVLASAETTVERNGSDTLETMVSRDESGAITFATVTTLDSDGNPVFERTYDGDPGSTSAVQETVYSYDEQGRCLSSVETELMADPYGIDGSQDYSIYPEFGEVNVFISGNPGNGTPEGYTLTVYDERGNPTYCFNDGNPAGAYDASPRVSHVEYDGYGNPIAALVQDPSATGSKHAFTYDDNGNLLSAVKVVFSGPFTPVEVIADVYAYENVEGEVIEELDPATLEVPEYVDDDSTNYLIYSQGVDFIEPMMHGGSWIMQVREPDEETMMPAGMLSISLESDARTSTQLLVGTYDEGGMAMDTYAPAQCYTAQDGSIYLATYDGTRLVMTPTGDGAMEVAGTLYNGEPIDTIATWDGDY